MQKVNLSEYIAEDIRRRLSEDHSRGISLKLDSLSREYDCSTRPVRTALGILTEEGILAKEPNGRIRLVRKPRKRAKTAKISQPNHEEVYFKIAQYMVQLGLVSCDEFVREEETAEKFSISRAQMRQFFQRLNVEGVLEHVPRRGWKVRAFDQKDLQDFVTTREALEVTALETAWPRLDKTVIAGFLTRNHLGQSASESRVDNGLHQYWIDRSENRYIQDFFRQHAPYFSILFTWEESDMQTVAEAILAHREILSYILAGNRVGAKEALSEHILTSHPVISTLAASRV